MREDDILAGVTEALGSVTGVDPADVTPTARFEEDLGVDSLTLVDLVVAVEDRFGLVIPDEEWARFVTVDDAIRYLRRAAQLPHRSRA
jgi:acyl carrier protein